MKKRECYIYEIELLSFSYPEASFRAIVSPWTYIRSLAYDLWEELRTGGYITVLTRLGIWNLSLQEAQNLKNFDKDKFLDVKKIFIWKEFIELDEKIISKLSNWISVSWKFEFKIWEELFVFDWKKISNIVIYDGKILIPKKNL
jgi:tRNA U55 pseudouridine synthase TruB